MCLDGPVLEGDLNLSVGLDLQASDVIVIIVFFCCEVVTVVDVVVCFLPS